MCSIEQALTARDHICQRPAVIARIHPAEVTALPLSVHYTIHASRFVSVPANRQIEAAIAAFATFLQGALVMTPEAAMRLARDEKAVTIAKDLERTVAIARMAELETLIPGYQDDALLVDSA